MNSSAVQGTQAVRRAVAVLKAFDQRRRTWTARALAEHLELNRTTVYRLLSALEAEGLVTRDEDSDAYRLGPETIALGARAYRSSDLRAAAHAELEALARDVGESATLEVLAGGDCLIVDEVPGPSVLGPAVEIGTRWPAHATSTGKVLLAFGDEERVRALPRRLARFTPRTLVTREALLDELAEARRRGWSSARDEMEEGFMAVGAPVRDRRGDVVAAVSIGGPVARLPADRLPEVARRVRKAGDRISRRLGSRLGDSGRGRSDRASGADPEGPDARTVVTEADAT